MPCKKLSITKISLLFFVVYTKTVTITLCVYNISPDLEILSLLKMNSNIVNFWDQLLIFILGGISANSKLTRFKY